jgi:ABC-type Mn2+/Zn2+ transport system ATPase subunit
MITVSDLSFAYHGGKTHALVKGQRSFAPGDAVAITGGNGTGKTTLLRIVAGLLKGFQGTCTVSPSAILAFVPAPLHNFLLPWYRVRENIRFFETRGADIRKGEDDRFAGELNELLGRSDSYDLLQREIYTLSAGEAAAVALTCALRTQPTLLLLDEIFANGSKRTIGRFAERLKRFCGDGGLVLFTSHHIESLCGLPSQEVELGEYEGS